MHDQATLTAIVDAAEVGQDDIVLEIGPGLGTLTRVLLTRAKKVVAVEFDEALASKLVDNLKSNKLEVVQADILKFDLSVLPKGYKVVANIPYYLTSNLIRRLCEDANHFSEASLLVQKEVAERVCAKPGQMSLLSVATQFYCSVGLAEVVPARLFTPPPKVDSQILLLNYNPKPIFKDVDHRQFFRLVKAGFSERRKKLRSSLSGGLGINKVDADKLLYGAGIDNNLRAQNLSLEQWHELYKECKKMTSPSLL